MGRVVYRIVVEASFADKVRAIRTLVEFYRRRLPERSARLERSGSAQGRGPAEPSPGTPR